MVPIFGQESNLLEGLIFWGISILLAILASHFVVRHLKTIIDFSTLTERKEVGELLNIETRIILIVGFFLLVAHIVSAIKQSGDVGFFKWGILLGVIFLISCSFYLIDRIIHLKNK